MSELKFEITQVIATISEGNKGWNKEINMVSWNDNEPKYDIRTWSPNHEKVGKGITLSKEELIALKDILNELL